jgi:N-acetyl-anhydromuramyl-L-alanine amidase AmpD
LEKPKIKAFIQSPNYSDRDGVKIQNIVVHCTNIDNVQRTIDWFLDTESQVSAHYIIDRSGDIFQMVKDQDKAWHCRKYNDRSIGIEHVATVDLPLAPEQEKSSILLISWLLEEYSLTPDAILGHKYVPSCDTDCPNVLFGPRQTEEELKDWIKKNFGGFGEIEMSKVKKIKTYILSSKRLKSDKVFDRSKYCLEHAEDLLQKMQPGESLTITVGEEDEDDEDYYD